MTSFIALLRGINVGGNKAVPMAEVRAMMESLGFTGVRTLLQSGNVVFQSKPARVAELEKRLEGEALQRLGHPVDFLIRDAKEWREIVAANPFAREAADDPGHLLVMCLKSEPKAESLAALKTAIVGREYFHARGRQLYLVYPDGVGDSKLTNVKIESKLGTRGSARNWNTVGKIAALLEGMK